MKDHYTLKNIKKVKWGVLEPNQPISLYPVMYPGWDGAIAGTGKHLGKFQKNIICMHIKDRGLIMIDHREWNKLGIFVLRKVVNNFQWGKNLIKKILKYSDELVNFSSIKIFNVDLDKLSNSELFILYDKYLVMQSRVYNCSLLPVYLDLYKPHLTSYLVEYLYERVQKFTYQKTAKECFALLTIPEKLSKVQLEEIELLKIANEIRKLLKKKQFSKKNLPKLIINQLKSHIIKHRYMGYNFEGPAFFDSYYWKKLKEEVVDKKSPAEKMNSILKKKSQAKQIHNKIVKELKIDIKHQELFKVTQGFIYSKDYRKMALVQSYYEIEPLLREIGKRIGLTLAEVRNTLLDEIKLMLEGKLKRPKDLSKRLQGCLYVVINGKLPGRVFVNSKFRIMKKYLMKEEDFSEVNYFHGQSACLGNAQGDVKIINTKKDLSKMRPGDIMVSNMTNPDLVPAMKKAAAIVTDLGGITCHAAIVSRELKIPCVIGTQVATKVLQDGDRVFVDANQGEIKKI